jgi:hypothetical protein
MKRFFTIVHSETGKEGGRYGGASPAVAAKHAAKQLFAGTKNAKKQVRFTIRETTRGSEKGEFTYIGTKTALETPKTIMRNNVEITVKHTIAVKSCSAD